MKHSSILAAFAVSVVLLAGCAGGPVGESANVEPAMSQQTPVSNDRERAKVHTDLGRRYLVDGRYEVALEEATTALEADASYAPAHDLTALVYMGLRKKDLSEQSFRRALGLAGNDPEINNDYGWFLCQSGRAKESIARFRVAIDNPLYQSPSKALTNAGVCSIAAKDDKGAENFFLRALQLDRANPNAMYWLADINYRAGRPDEARQWLVSLHGMIDPTAQSAWLGLRIDRKLGDREGQARFMGILQRKFRDSSEYLKMTRGEFD